MPTWSFVARWRCPPDPVLTWRSLGRLVELHHRVERVDLARLEAMLDRWHSRLAISGGDPSETNWSGFRPLRLSREEDWSDWLQHLLAHPDGRVFARKLLGATERDSVDSVEREVRVAARRADLVVHFASGCHAQLEVKVGDRAFAKTVDTARALESVVPGRWRHMVIVPPDDLESARLETASSEPIVDVLSWRRVVVLLRASLLALDTSVTWRVWATAFCGAVEQRLLSLPVRAPRLEASLARPLLSILEEAEQLWEERDG